VGETGKPRHTFPLGKARHSPARYGGVQMRGSGLPLRHRGEGILERRHSDKGSVGASLVSDERGLDSVTFSNG
jgi:hypothetical protein